MRNLKTQLLMGTVLSFATAVSAVSTSAWADTEEIIVTATKREESLFEVPMAITALSSEELEQRGITAVSELQFAVPGLTMREDGPGSNTIFLRGLVNQYGSGSVVGQYLDEVPISLTGYDQLDVRVLDLERIEVLKGPQGTLYGQGSVAGTIRYITKKPVLDAVEASIGASIAQVDDGDTKETISGVFNAPIIKDKLALRVAATLEQGGGWQDQPEVGIEDGNNQDLVNIRTKALWELSDAVEIEAMYHYHRNQSELGLGYENEDRTVFVAGDPNEILIPKVQKFEIGNVNVIVDLGFAELTSATSYIDNYHQYPTAYVCGPDTTCDLFQGNDERVDSGSQFTQELRLTSLGDGPISWTVGAYYRDVTDTLSAYYDSYFDRFVGNLPYFSDLYIAKGTSESYALFADVAYQLTDRFELGVGGRYFHDEQTYEENTAILFFGDAGWGRQSGSFQNLDPRVYASYELTDTVNLYGSIASGFRSGGFNGVGQPKYDPETVLSYELGAKGSMPNAALEFEAAVFYHDYSDMLRRGLVPNGLSFEQLLSNIGDVEVWGIEAGFAFKPIESFTFSATGAYFFDAEVKAVSFDDIADPYDLTSNVGDPIDYLPEISFTVSGVYEFDWSENMPGFARLDYAYRDEVSYVDRTIFDVVPQYSDSFGLLDGRVGLEFGKASFELFGTNLTNENAWQDPYHQWRNANRTRPRVLGVRVNYDIQ